MNATARTETISRWYPVGIAFVIGVLFPVGGLVCAIVFSAFEAAKPVDKPVRYSLLGLMALWTAVVVYQLLVTR